MSFTEDQVSRSGETLFVSQLAVIDRVSAFVCARHHLSPADADDFSSHVRLKLIENEYAVLRKFEGRSTMRTFLSVVIERLFLDYRIQAWGKWRPSIEAKRAGAVGVLLERLLTRDGYRFDEACELMATNHGVRTSRNDLALLAGRLPLRVARKFENEVALAALPAPDRADAAAVAHEKAVATARISAALIRARTRFEPQDQLILALRFDDGKTVAEIASMLRLDQKTLYRRFDRLLRELRTALEAEGITAEEARETFDGLAVTTPGEAEEKSMTRPSLIRGVL
jgi:RNA polymerase sigma factor for flagellar operon FliA